MDISQWWSKLSDDSKLWLLQNADSPQPPEVSAEIAAAGGTADSLSETDLAFIDEVNNGGSPAGS